MIEKNGMLTSDSHSDFDNSKKAEYIDESSPFVADEANKYKLIKPVKTPDYIKIDFDKLRN